MNNKEINIGDIFYRWKVIGIGNDRINNNGRIFKTLICECQCKDKIVKSIEKRHLLSGSSKSCGCLQKEKASIANKKYNVYDLSGEYGIGYTSNTNEPFYFDLEDYDKIKNYSWFKNKRGYINAHDSYNGTIIMLHRLLFNLSNNEPIQIDHINNKHKFDNRKSNLRICTMQENNRNRGLFSVNTSGITGVSFVDKMNKWQSYIYVNYKKIHLGTYENLQDAIIIRLKKEKELFKEFAPQRHLFEQYNI